MKKKKHFRRLITLVLALVLSVGCLTISGSALDGSLDEFLKSRFTDKQIELIYRYFSEVQGKSKADLANEFKNAKYEDNFAKRMVHAIKWYGYHYSENIVDVRANGNLVEFTDAKPYIDENNRTMIPLRAAVEALGAEVAWDQATRTASVSKNGITVQVTIGSQTLTIINNGQTSYETMDTVAVLNTEEGRTYVPIRYVAEALGAYVDYADAFRTVGIYSDVLTSEEIEELRSYAYTLPKDAITYEKFKNDPEETEESLITYYGPYRETFGNFANAHEDLYYNKKPILTIFNDLGKNVVPASPGEHWDLVVAEAIAEVSYSSETLIITFRADPSCAYQPDAMGIMATVRGYLSITAPKGSGAWTVKDNEAMFYIIRSGLSKLPKEGETLTFPMDIHMNILAGYDVHINTFVALGPAQ